MIDGLRLALTLFTVAPARAGRVDRRAAAAAIGLAPLVGALLGVVLGGVAGSMVALGAPALLAAVAAVASGALLTRALHLDGLADTLDALGSYAPRERALAIMKQPDIGPFGVVGLVLALLAQVAAAAAILPRGWLAAVAGLAVAAATGRLAVTWACRRGVPAARPEGLGALVAGTAPWPVPAAWTVVVAALAVVAVPGRPWQGPAAVLAGLAAAALLARHAVRRFGGITGDVLGAVLEVGVTVTLVATAIG
ncbi:MAG: adenosylcobinamide-GDP ribazoletransferase [Micromonosporaceae bacterium]|nr:adenosylcobinamide-GDP ribazoletransferase [Micromonosporaceae bacterium]